MPVTLSKTGCFFRSLPGGIVVRFFEACVCHPVSGAWGSQGHAEHKYELPCKEKLKFEYEEKKFTLLLKREVCGYFWLENATFKGQLNSE